MATGFNKNYNGVTLVPQNTTAPSTDGDLRYNSATNKAELFNGAVDPIVTEADTATLTNKTLTGNTATNLVNGSGTFDFNSTGTITAPNGTDTLAGVALTQTLTNKTIAAGSNTITGLTNTSLSGTAAITNANLAQMAAGTVKANTTGSSATPADVSVASIVVAGGGVTSVGTLDSEATPSANAITIASGAITAQSASATAPGVVNTTTQTFAGAKTFSTSVSSPAITGSSSVTSPSHVVTGTGGNVTVGPASGTTTSYALALPAAQGLTNTTLQNDGSGNLTWQPAGAGSGSKNYLGVVNGANNNGNFELGTTTGWSTFGTTLTGVIPTGTIGAVGSGVTFGVTSLAANVLGGSYSGIVSSSAAFPAGSGLISNAFTIDQEDQAKVLTFKFYYKNAFSTSYVNFSGTSSNTFAVYIYDVTNSAWIQPAGVYSMTQTSGVGYATGTFQTTSNSTQYRLGIVAVNASTGTGSIYVDDFFCGPQTAPIGPVVTDWISYTPTGIWTTNATYSGKWRRVGDTMEISAGITTSGAVTGTFTINLPSGYTIDVTKFTGTSSSVYSTERIGSAECNSGGAQYPGAVRYYSSTSIGVVDFNGTSPVSEPAYWSGSTPFSSGNGGLYNVIFRVPIVGWSSNVQMSSDTDTRVIAANATGSSTSTASGSFTTVAFTSTSFDTAGAMGTSTYTVPVSGFYSITGILKWPSYSVGYNAAAINQNGTQSDLLCYAYNGGTSSTGTMVSGVLKCNAGDTLNLTAYQGSGGSVSLAGATLSINRLSGPSVIAATESVNARYTNTAGTSISATPTAIPWATKDYDSHNAMNTTTGVYTVPVSGKYLITSLCTVNTSANTFELDVYKNGSFFSILGLQTSSAANLRAGGTETVNCLAGDTISVNGSITVSGTTLATPAGFNHISIQRVGN